MMAAVNTVRVANKPTPAAKPSSPSTRLNAFMQASSHRIVSGTFHHASVGVPPIDIMRTPPQRHAKPGRPQLPDQFNPRLQIEKIVQHADAEYQRRSRQ